MYIEHSGGYVSIPSFIAKGPIRLHCGRNASKMEGNAPSLPVPINTIRKATTLSSGTFCQTNPFSGAAGFGVRKNGGRRSVVASLLITSFRNPDTRGHCKIQPSPCNRHGSGTDRASALPISWHYRVACRRRRTIFIHAKQVEIRLAALAFGPIVPIVFGMFPAFVRRYLFSAKGATLFQPGATPQELPGVT